MATKLFLEIMSFLVFLYIILGTTKPITYALWQILIIASVLVAGTTFFTLSILTYPITYILRYKGYKVRSFFQIGMIVWNFFDPSISGTSNAKTESQNDDSYEKNQETSSSTPPTEIPSADPWHILGIQKGATKEEIIKAYKVKMSINHPDKVANMDTEIQELALQRAKIINEAYSQLVG